VALFRELKDRDRTVQGGKVIAFDSFADPTFDSFADPKRPCANARHRKLLWCNSL
jgi:hypothetical protein